MYTLSKTVKFPTLTFIFRVFQSKPILPENKLDSRNTKFLQKREFDEHSFKRPLDAE